MEFKTLRCQLMDLMDKIKVADINAVKRYFQNTLDGENIEYYINERVIFNDLDREEGSDIIRLHDAPAYDPLSEKRHIKAFWLIANIGYGSIPVSNICLQPEPNQYFFYTEGGPDETGNPTSEMYDVAVAEDEGALHIAMLNRKNLTVKSAPDKVVHIAFVSYKKLGETAINDYGFDVYCTISDDNKITYGGLEQA